MLTTLKTVYHYFGMYYNKSNILYLYIVCLIALYFFGKEKRRLIVYPTLLITFVIANPILYKFVWVKLIKGTYWRMLWMIPVVPVIACTAITIIEKVNRKYISVVLTVIFLVFVAITNTRIYSRNTHVEVHNAYKLPDSTVSVCKYLIEAENGGEVQVIMPVSIYCYARQYDNRIHQLYGRDADNYMASNLLTKDEKAVANELRQDNPDMEFVTRVAKESGCKYIVCDPHNIIDDDKMASYGYSMVRNEVGYRIYVAIN